MAARPCWLRHLHEYIVSAFHSHPALRFHFSHTTNTSLVVASGTINSFGVFQAFYQSSLLASSTPSAISWIGSVQCFLGMGFGIFAGPMYDRGFLRVLIASGTFLVALGMFLTSISSYYHLILVTQGICMGLGMGLTFVPILGEVSRLFTTQRRPIALGLSSTGACVGGILFPVLIRQLLPKVGFGWTVRVLALINLTCGMVSFAIICRRPIRVSSTSRRLFDLAAFDEIPFTLFSAGMFLVFVPYYIPMTYIPVFAQTKLQAPEDMAGYALAIVNAGQLIGRTVPYVLGSRVTPIRNFFFWILAATVVLFAWMGVTTIAGVIVWCVIWGAVSGVLATAPVAAVSHPVLTPNPKELGTRMGMSLLAAAIGDLVGPPIGGALVGVSGDYYSRAQVASGVIMMLGGLCVLWPLMAINRASH